LARPRENRTFSGLDLDAQLRKPNTEPRCGFAVINLKTGDMASWVRVEGVVRELYDVVALSVVRTFSTSRFCSSAAVLVLAGSAGGQIIDIAGGPAIRRPTAS
jgi:hypothetical protein